MAWAIVVGAGIGLAGAAYSSHQARKAGDQQAEGTQRGIDENGRQYDQTRADHMPFLDAGKVALGQFAKENDTPLDVSNLQMDPGYEFARQQGQQGIDRQAAAAGGRISGASLKAAAQYSNNTATAGYSAAYGRANQARTDRLNRLAALADVGQTATDNIGALGSQTASRNSALLVNQGDNAGSATMAQGNIWGNAANQIAALYGRKSEPGAQNIQPRPYG